MVRRVSVVHNYYKKDLGLKTGCLGKPKEYTMCFYEDRYWYVEIEEFYEMVAQGQPLRNGKPDEAVRGIRIVRYIYNTASHR